MDLEGISSHIVISVTAGSIQAGFTGTTLLHGMNHLQLIILCHTIDLLKSLFQTLSNFLSERIDFPINSHFFVHFFCYCRIHNFLFFLSCISYNLFEIFHAHLIIFFSLNEASMASRITCASYPKSCLSNHST